MGRPDVSRRGDTKRFYTQLLEAVPPGEQLEMALHHSVLMLVDLSEADSVPPHRRDFAAGLADAIRQLFPETGVTGLDRGARR